MAPCTDIRTSAPAYTCSTCEVTWTSYDSACWMCGRDAAHSSTERMLDPTRPPRHGGAPAGSPGDGGGVQGDRQAAILRAHAMGLPDPRYLAHTRA